MKSSSKTNSNINNYSDQYEIEEDELEDEEEEDVEKELSEAEKNKIGSKPATIQIKARPTDEIKCSKEPAKSNIPGSITNKTFQNIKPTQPQVTKQQPKVTIDTKPKQSPILKAQPQGKPIQNQYKVTSPIHEESSSDGSNHEATGKFKTTYNPKFNQTNSSDIPVYDDKFSPDFGFYESEKIYMLSSENHTLNPYKIMHKDNDRQGKLAQPTPKKLEMTINSKKSDTRKYIGSDDEGDESDEDIEKELVGESQQILDYQRSMSSKYRFNTNYTKQTNQTNQSNPINQKATLQTGGTDIQGNQKKPSMDAPKELKEPNEDELSQLKKENLKLRQRIVKLESENCDKEESEVSDLKQKLNIKIKEAKDANHMLSVTEEINTELESGICELKSKIQSLKQELQTKDEKLSKTDEAEEKFKNLKEKNYNLMAGMEELEEELSRRTAKVAELQGRVDILEQEKKEAVSKVMAELMAIKENQMSYEQLRMNNLELKNSNDLMSLKLATLSEENNTLRREVFFLEKELNNKSSILNRITMSKGSENDYTEVSGKPRLRTQESDFPETYNKQEKVRDSYKRQSDEVVIPSEIRKNRNFSQVARPDSSTANNPNSDNYFNNMSKNQRSQVFGGTAEKTSQSNQSKQINKKDPNTSSQNKDLNLLAFNNKPEDSNISSLESKISNLQTERVAVSSHNLFIS